MNSLLNARVVFGKNCLERNSILNVEMFVVSVFLVICMTLIYLYGSKKETSDHKRFLKL